MVSIQEDPTLSKRPEHQPIARSATGIPGFDEISHGGLPQGRLIGVVGGPGAGKTVFALQTLVGRARLLGESGVMVCFEEREARLRSNALAFEWGFEDLNGSRIVLLDGRLPPDALLSGDFDLSGILAQVGSLVEQVGATLVVLDGLDMILASLADTAHERRELLRIDQWMHSRLLTCIVTGKSTAQDTREVARQDCIHYMTDMVVELGGRVDEGAFTRFLRIVKCRGSDYMANAFPALITERGLEIIAKTDSNLTYPTFDDRLSTGAPGLDDLLEGGFRRGTTILVTGAPGTAKTSLAGQFTAKACERDERVVYVSFDESAEQILNDLRTIGIDLELHRATGNLTILSMRSTSRGPDSHYVKLRLALDQYEPTCLIVDPISALIRPNYSFSNEVCEHLLDETRGRGITTFCTWLSAPLASDDDLAISTPSTIADTWLHLTYNTRGGERNRALTIIKCRGTDHSNQVREVIIGPKGLELVDVYTAEGEVLMGSARAQREATERLDELELRLLQSRQEFEITEALASLEMQHRATESQLRSKRKELELLTDSSSALVDNQREAAADRLRRRRSTWAD